MNILIIIIATIVGVSIGWTIRHLIASSKILSAEKKAEELLRNAKVKGQEIFFRGREEALKTIERAKTEEQERLKELRLMEERLEKRQSLFEKKLLDLEYRQKEIDQQSLRIEEAKKKIKQIYQEITTQLEKVSQMTVEEAKLELLNEVEKRSKDDLLNRIRKLQNQESEILEKEAKKILTDVIERIASSHAAESTTSSVSLPSEEMKGRIIGREGRNIKAIEQLTGAEIIVDDTPAVIFVSAFSPIRRQLAKRALERLILDGRIQPARIEKIVEETKKDLAKEIKEAGEEAVYQLGITGLDPKLIQILGRLKFRTSYGQNVLGHSIEVANLSALLAEELGAEPILAKKAGFFHDLGKSVDQETEGTHPQIGEDLAKKFGLPEEIIIAIKTHHEDHPPNLIAVLVKVADAISGARPGARRDSYESYLKRLEDLEKVAKGFSGVERVYAISAGRELRVFVTPTEIDDLEATNLARKIAQQIEKDLKYPGEIKVMVIRENRIIEYAR